MVNFADLKAVYNNQMDILLAKSGLATECVLNFGISKKDVCSNCIFDVALKKSSNKYKSGGPIAFATGQLCPYCNGTGYYGEEKTETIYLAIIWDNAKWINPPTNIVIPDGMIQTICDRTYLSSIRKCKDMTIKYHVSNRDNPKYALYSEPTPAGLGDNNYILTMWKIV
jgi:hypothetical protein